MVRNILRKFLSQLPDFLKLEEVRILDAAIHRRQYQEIFGYPENHHHGYWERMGRSWGKEVPPVRPSEGDIRIYHEFLKQSGTIKNILILGSTPELRDLAAKESSARIYVADFSHHMLVSTLTLTKDVDPAREKWIKDNWLDLPFPENFFDVVMGDVVLHQVTPNFEYVFLDKIRFFLRKDGYLITRAFFLNNDFLKNDLATITNQILKESLTKIQKLTLLKLQTVWLFADLAKRKFNRDISAEEFFLLLKKRNFQDPLLNDVNRILRTDKNSYRTWSPPEEGELMRILSRSFVVRDKKIAEDYYYAKYFPIFFLSPKG